MGFRGTGPPVDPYTQDNTAERFAALSELWPPPKLQRA